MNDVLLERISILPSVCHGKPVIRNSRIMVATVLELLAAGTTFEELLEDYSEISLEDIYACLWYASLLANRQISLN
jgi:uncharacterized protein (DUF433 family)